VKADSGVVDAEDIQVVVVVVTLEEVPVAMVDQAEVDLITAVQTQ
jgi:hypothetical protein